MSEDGPAPVLASHPRETRLARESARPRLASGEAAAIGTLRIMAGPLEEFGDGSLLPLHRIAKREPARFVLVGAEPVTGVDSRGERARGQQRGELRRHPWAPHQ